MLANLSASIQARLVLFFVLSLVFLSSSPSWAQKTQPAGPSATSNSKPSAPERDPSLSDFIQRIETFNAVKEKFLSQITSQQEPEAFKEAWLKLHNDFQDFESRLQEKRALSSWNYVKLENFLVEFKKYFEELQRLKQSYLDYLKVSEGLEEELENLESTFRGSYKSIKKSELGPAQKKKVTEIFVFLKEQKQSLLSFRKEISEVYAANQALRDQISQLGQSLFAEEETFEKTLFAQSFEPLYSSGYWDMFTQKSLEEIKITWRQTFQWDQEQFAGTWMYYLLVLVGFFFSYSFFLYLKKQFSFPNPPLPLAFIFSSILAYLFIPKIPLWLLLAFWLSLPVFLYSLVGSYRFPEQVSRDLLKLFIAYSLVRVVELVDLPLSLYRLFLISFAVLLSVYGWLRYRKLSAESFYEWAIKVFVGLASLMFLLVALAEALGYHALALLMVYGLIKTAFLIFALVFAKRVFYQFLYFLFHLAPVQKLSLFRAHWLTLLTKMTWLLQVLMVLFAIIVLPTFWNVFSSFGEAKDYFLSLSFPIGEKALTLGMALEAAAFFYLAHLIAFLLCIVLQDEVYPRQQIDRGVANSINSLIKYGLWTVGIFVAFFALGFELKQLAIIAGALSVGIGFGLQNIVNNFVSGLIMLFERPVKVGDLLEIQGEWGEVEKVGLRSTVIRTYSKSQLIIPNSDFITQRVTNLTLSDEEYRVVVPVGIAYGSDVQKAKRIMEDVARAHSLVASQRKPRVVFKQFGNSSLDFEIYIWVREVGEKFIIISDILFEVEDRFRKEGVEIPFPQRDLHLRSVDEKAAQKLRGK